jgi:hypothetical protein
MGALETKTLQERKYGYLGVSNTSRLLRSIPTLKTRREAVLPANILKEALQEWLKARFEQYKDKAPVKDATPEEIFVMTWGTLGESMKAVNSMTMLPIHEQLEWAALAVIDPTAKAGGL